MKTRRFRPGLETLSFRLTPGGGFSDLSDLIDSVGDPLTPPGSVTPPSSPDMGDLTIFIPLDGSVPPGGVYAPWGDNLIEPCSSGATPELATPIDGSC